jgi:hypothetical protein
MNQYKKSRWPSRETGQKFNRLATRESPNDQQTYGKVISFISCQENIIITGWQSRQIH